ncbi:MAG TPA: 16S rRNA (cytidine(1402)-2'-O)-methyltransferase [Candidatus Hydrogenedentes bacterium]|nr:16S rRNA (cytidine(1402)-2'-O)-methyltransferase [Candidatus Hydrogenedentota bacterium]HNT86668.1 16S rRNA (cytidine(1402)-2'-O)-methyltransferase [Candidatus Hydrogenedentota bacterium]
MGTLYVIATPIGNLEDLTHRAARVLGEAGAVACEDTRVTPRLFERYGIARPKTLFSCHEHNEDHAAKRIVGLLADGVSVALCSEGGFPGVSDPGYRVITACIEAGHDIVVVPGPSAVHAALLASGLPTSSYIFKGFPPRKPGPRARFLEMDRDAPHTLIFFESPFRLTALLEAAHEAFGDRQAAVCVELTKKFERVRRGFLSELAEWYNANPVKGEITVVVAGRHPKFTRATRNLGEPGDAT